MLIGHAAGMAAGRFGHAGILILRAWTENQAAGVLRIRITRVVNRSELPVTAITDVDEACAIVRGWLEELLDPERPDSGHTDQQ